MNDNDVAATNVARRLWSVFEPVHAVTYFSPEARAAYEAAGLRGYWRGYFAGRSAAIGAVGPAPVTAAFFNFAPAMVARALPHVWELAPPERVLAARLEGAVAALQRLTAQLPADSIAEAAELATSAVDRLDPAGHVLGAAHAALPRPEEPVARLWWATTALREHRGDGHFATLTAAGVTGCEVLVWRASVDMDRQVLQPNRGWTDAQWDDARERLVARGWLTDDGQPTQTGLAGFARIEEATDRLAAQPWSRLGASAAQRLRELLYPLAVACLDEMPEQTPIGPLRRLLAAQAEPQPAA